MSKYKRTLSVIDLQSLGNQGGAEGGGNFSGIIDPDEFEIIPLSECELYCDVYPEQMTSVQVIASYIKVPDGYPFPSRSLTLNLDGSAHYELTQSGAVVGFISIDFRQYLEKLKADGLVREWYLTYEASIGRGTGVGNKVPAPSGGVLAIKKSALA